MKNPFKPSGFDTLIGKDMVLNDATLILPENSTTVIDGSVSGPAIHSPSRDGKPPKDTTLVINGTVLMGGAIEVPNVTITGNVTCQTLIVHGVLAIKAGAKITADEIRYRSLVIETGAVVLAKMVHLDHTSAVVES